MISFRIQYVLFSIPLLILDLGNRTLVTVEKCRLEAVTWLGTKTSLDRYGYIYLKSLVCLIEEGCLKTSIFNSFNSDGLRISVILFFSRNQVIPQNGIYFYSIESNSIFYFKIIS